MGTVAFRLVLRLGADLDQLDEMGLGLAEGAGLLLDLGDVAEDAQLFLAFAALAQRRHPVAHQGQGLLVVPAAAVVADQGGQGLLLVGDVAAGLGGGEAVIEPLQALVGTAHAQGGGAEQVVGTAGAGVVVDHAAEIQAVLVAFHGLGVVAGLGMDHADAALGLGQHRLVAVLGEAVDAALIDGDGSGVLAPVAFHGRPVAQYLVGLEETAQFIVDAGAGLIGGGGGGELAGGGVGLGLQCMAFRHLHAALEGVEDPARLLAGGDGVVGGGLACGQGLGHLGAGEIQHAGGHAQMVVELAGQFDAALQEAQGILDLAGRKLGGAGAQGGIDGTLAVVGAVEDAQRLAVGLGGIGMVAGLGMQAAQVHQHLGPARRPTCLLPGLGGGAEVRHTGAQRRSRLVLQDQQAQAVFVLRLFFQFAGHRGPPVWETTPSVGPGTGKSNPPSSTGTPGGWDSVRAGCVTAPALPSAARACVSVRRPGGSG